MNKSVVINPQTSQLTLDFQPGLTAIYQSARECVAAGIYKRGLGNVAIDLNKAPGNLSVEVSDDQTRHFSLDSFEAYLEKSGDYTALYYFCEKFLSDKSAKKDAAQAQLLTLLAQLQPLMKQAGVA